MSNPGPKVTAEDETGVDSISGKTRKQLYEEAGLEWYGDGSEHLSRHHRRGYVMPDDHPPKEGEDE